MPMPSRYSDHAAAQAGPEHRAPRPEKPRTPTVVTQRMVWLEAEIDLLQGSLETVRARLKNMAGDIDASAQSGEETSAVSAHYALTERRVKITERLDALLAMRNRAEAWLKVAGTLEDARPKIKIPTEDAALKSAIDDLRNEIAKAKFDLATVQRAPVKVNNLKAQVRALVLGLASKGAPPTAEVKSDGQVSVDFTSWAGIAEPYYLLAWVDPDKLTDRLVAHIQQRQSQLGREAMTADERSERLAAIKTQIDRLERRDVFLTEAAIDREGLKITYRPDSAVDAFLGVRAHRAPVSNAAIQAASR